MVRDAPNGFSVRRVGGCLVGDCCVAGEGNILVFLLLCLLLEDNVSGMDFLFEVDFLFDEMYFL